MNYTKTWVLVVFWGLLDVILTLQAPLHKVHELNPLARYLLSSALPNYIALTSLTLVCVSTGILLQHWMDEEYDFIPVSVFATIWAIPVVWNSWQLITM